MSFATKLTGVPARLVRLIDVSELYFQHIVAGAAQAGVPNAGTVSGAALRRTRCVSFALTTSAVCAAWCVSAAEVPPLVTMYSYDGPVIVEPSGFFASGNCAEAVRALRSPSSSQPLHTMVYPRGMRKEFASTVGLVIDAGSSPPPETRASAVQVLPPRLGGSYITR